MAERERVREAIQTPVDEAVKLLDASPNADEHVRLQMLINGWGRGIAAGLEELAIAIGDLGTDRRSELRPSRTQRKESRRVPRRRPPSLQQQAMRSGSYLRI